jgi:hypothetical protein
MHALVLLVALAAADTPVARECASPPSRAESGYWSYIEACGCSQLDPPSRASADYDRYMKACADWRERQVRAVAPPRSAAPECDDPPSRAADGYWDYIEACGCARLEAPSKASSDHDRFMQACAGWRERNPQAAPAEESAPPSPPSR